MGFAQNVALAAPLFVLVALGYCLARWLSWPKDMWAGLTTFVFSVALPALLFRQMSDLSELPPVDARLLIAFFGGCLAVFVVGRLLAWWLFSCDGAEQTVFALGGVLSNNVLLGIPLATVTLGPDSLPSVAMVLVFNALVLWTLATASVEWARTRSLSAGGVLQVIRSVLTTPVVAGILAGTAVGLAGLRLPGVLYRPIEVVASTATPLALVALGASLVGYQVSRHWGLSAAICVLKLLLHPLAVWGLAVAVDLPTLETQVVTLLASLSVGANVFLMAKRFGVLEGPVAASLLISTALSAVTAPVALTLLRA